MNNKLKEKLIETLEAYDNDLEYIWQSSDSGYVMERARQKQKELAELIDQLRGE